MKTVEIIRLGHRGDGVAEGPVFVPRALPGEVVSGDVTEGRMDAPRIDAPSPDRVSAPCPHYRGCGGCALQHASDDFVARWKIEQVRLALAAQGLDTAFRPIETSPSHSRRRAGFAARRTKKGTLVGFHGRASDTIVEIPRCHLLHPDLLTAIPCIAALAATGASRKGVLSILATRSDAGLDLNVTGGKPLDGQLRMDLGPLAERYKLARLAWEGEVIALRAPPVLTFGAARVVPPPGAFLQATAEGERALVEAVLDIVGEASRITELFAGCGTFSLPLARGAAVHAVEGDRAMLDALDQGWRAATGIKKVTTEARDLFRRPLTGDELRADAVVLDPPRAGAEAQTAEIARAQIPVVAYVSCNPVTFARDAKILVGAGYRLNWVQVVDQFRWSPHTELAASFTLAHMSNEPNEERIA